MNTSFLIVDDETTFLSSMVRRLRMLGYEDVHAVSDPTTVAALLKTKSFDVAFLDIVMPGMNGLEVLEIIKEQSPATECIMITANEDIPTVIQAVKLGAYDYLVKPVDPDHLAHTLENALERKRMQELLDIRRRDQDGDLEGIPEAFADIQTCDNRMQRLLHEAQLHAQSIIPVLITGETGVGKELMARAVHKASPRSAEQFVAVNMLSVSPSLFESEFFGYKKGAFTGANADKAGFLSQAEGGTLFLDEIGDLPKEIQGKLLRMLQESEYTPVGHTRAIKADVRFVAATNQDLEKLVEKGKFRRDLYYRLRFASLHIPPLRSRADDIRLLATWFVREYSGAKVTISDAAIARLMVYEFPGNIRELKGTLEAACNLAEGGVITERHLNLPGQGRQAMVIPGQNDPLEPLAEIERQHILKVYQAVDNNKSQAARILGINFKTLLRKLKAYDVE